MAAGQFRVVGERELYCGRRMQLVERTIEGPQGERFEREMFRSRGAVATVPLDGDDVILVRQYRAALDREVLEIPAGVCDVDGEPPEETAQRELAEEAGFRAGRLDRLLTFAVAVGMTDHLTTIFLARDLEPCPLDLQGPEESAMTIERLPLATAAGLVGSGGIEDAKTILGLLLARDLVGAS